MKLFVAAAGLLLISSPALAETTPWVGASAGININGGGVSLTGRAGVGARAHRRGVGCPHA